MGGKSSKTSEVEDKGHIKSQSALLINSSFAIPKKIQESASINQIWVNDRFSIYTISQPKNIKKQKLIINDKQTYQLKSYIIDRDDQIYMVSNNLLLIIKDQSYLSLLNLTTAKWYKGIYFNLSIPLVTYLVPQGKVSAHLNPIDPKESEDIWIRFGKKGNTMGLRACGGKYACGESGLLRLKPIEKPDAIDQENILDIQEYLMPSDRKNETSSCPTTLLKYSTDSLLILRDEDHYTETPTKLVIGRLVETSIEFSKQDPVYTFPMISEINPTKYELLLSPNKDKLIIRSFIYDNNHSKKNINYLFFNHTGNDNWQAVIIADSSNLFKNIQYGRMMWYLDNSHFIIINEAKRKVYQFKFETEIRKINQYELPPKTSQQTYHFLNTGSVIVTGKDNEKINEYQISTDINSYVEEQLINFSFPKEISKIVSGYINSGIRYGMFSIKPKEILQIDQDAENNFRPILNYIS